MSLCPEGNEKLNRRVNLQYPQRSAALFSQLVALWRNVRLLITFSSFSCSHIKNNAGYFNCPQRILQDVIYNDKLNLRNSPHSAQTKELNGASRAVDPMNECALEKNCNCSTVSSTGVYIGEFQEKVKVRV